MRVLFTSLRNTSHLLPLVPFIDACLRRGHEVAISAPPDLAERATATGAAFYPFGHPGDEGLRPIWARMRDAPKEEAGRMAIAELFAGACARAALPGLSETVERWRPSIVVRESQEYAAIIAAEKSRIPHVRVAITSRDSEMQIIPLAVPAVDALGRDAGLSPDAAGESLIGEPALTFFPPCFQDPSDPAPVRRFRAARKRAAPLPDWWGALPGPFVYVTLGTVTGSMEAMRSACRVALDGVRDLPVRALFTIGADLPIEELGEVPPHVHVERFVPQDDVLPHAAAVLCHGGSGTVLGTLAAGVPMVVMPLFADQPHNAERVAAIGAGIAMPPREATADDLERALSRVLEEPSFRTAAQRVAAEIAALPLVDEAAVALETLARTG